MPLRVGPAVPVRSSRFDILTGVVNMVDQAPGLGFLGAHEIVAVESALDLLVGAAAMLGVELGHAALGLDDVLGVAGDVGGLALEATEGLVEHDAGIGQDDAAALRA